MHPIVESNSAFSPSSKLPLLMLRSRRRWAQAFIANRSADCKEMQTITGIARTTIGGRQVSGTSVWHFAYAFGLDIICPGLKWAATITIGSTILIGTVSYTYRCNNIRRCYGHFSPWVHIDNINWKAGYFRWLCVHHLPHAVLKVSRNWFPTKRCKCFRMYQRALQ